MVQRRALYAVIFDLDGVLTDTAEFHFRAWQQLANEKGLHFDRAANEHLRGLSREASLRAILDGSSVPSCEFQSMMARKNDLYLAALEGLSEQDLLPGALDLIVDCKRRGLQVAVGSSSKNAAMVLERLGIRRLFDAVADGTTVAETKPSPEVFLVAATLLGVSPEGCVVVEDAASGVDAALAAGMLTVGVGPDDRVGHATLRFDSTADVDLDHVLES